jgi:hypothetical protein
MDCRRAARELIEYFRFGDLDERSEPHLDHLDTCLSCRREVGLDRELVHHLQRTLHERISGAHEASPETWLAIRRRALEPERVGWRARLLPTLRLVPVGAMVIVVAVLAGPVVGGALRDQPRLMSLPTAQGFVEAAANDPVDPFDGRWWLRYTSPPPPSEPPRGILPAVELRERQATPSQPASGPAR